MDPTALAVLALAALLAGAALLVPAARALGLPYTVLLAALGTAIGAAIAAAAALPAPFGALLMGLETFRVSSDTLLYVLLPPLLFAGGLTIDTRRLLDEIAPVLLLAIIAVVATTLAVGLALASLAGLGLVLALLIGAIVATTDTAAVLSIFRDIGAPRRLSIIVEGESLFNDAAAIALFSVLLAILAAGAAPDWGGGLMLLGQGLVGGALFGVVAARIAAALIPLLHGAALSEITLSVALSYLTFVIADVALGVSGIIAVVAAAIAFASDARTRVSAGTWEVLLAIWRQLDFWAATLIFVLAATVAPSALANLTVAEAGAIACVYLAAMGARAAVLFGLFPLLSAARLAEDVGGRTKLVLLWGGIRGAVTVALALALQERPGVAPEDARTVLTLAVGYVLATLFLNAPTLRPLMRMLKLDVLEPHERAIRDRVMDLSRRKVGEDVARIARDLRIDECERPALCHLDDETQARELTAEMRERVGLAALANREAELVYSYLARGMIGRAIADQMIGHAGRMLEGVKSAGQAGYDAAWQRNHAMTAAFRAALWLQRLLGWNEPLARQIALRFELLLIKQRLMRDLGLYAREQIAPLIGAAATARLSEALSFRTEAVDDAMAALELQYPDYAGELRRVLLARASLGLELAEYREKRDQTLIPNEVYEDLDADIQRRAQRLVHRPRIDLGLKITEMLSKVPLLKAIGPQELRGLARYLTPRIALPGETIIRAGERAREMYFVASGHVRVRRDPHDIRLGPGEFFGEIALLTDTRRTADVVAEGYGHLLVLRRSDLDRFLRSSPDLKAAIAAVAEARMSANRAASA